MTTTASPDRPPSLAAWIHAAAHAGLTARAVTLHLEDWHVDDDQRIGLLELHSDLAAAIALRQADIDAWLTRLPHTEPGRCARCRRDTHDQPRYTIDDRELCARCATAQRPRTGNTSEAA